MAGNQKYRATLKAKPGTLLRGGVRSWTSMAWSREDAENLLAAMMEQPNAGEGKVVPIAAKRKTVKRKRKAKR